ncbi:MAG TPA: hypothetical protein ENH91_05840 [Leeuwenhoekiella sp.]|nr:hypothetical protein [Leeuwenhoekiella sp.]
MEGHAAYRQYYDEYITNSAIENGLVTFYWDNGYAGNNGFALFDRATGTLIEPELTNAFIAASK